MYETEEASIVDPIAEERRYNRETPIHGGAGLYTVKAKRLEIRTGADFESKGTGNYLELGEVVDIRRRVTIKGAAWGMVNTESGAQGWVPLGFITKNSK